MNTILNNRSTGVACINTNRTFIGMELDNGYFDIAKKRINDHIKEKEQNKTLFD